MDFVYKLFPFRSLFNLDGETQLTVFSKKIYFLIILLN